MAQARRDENRVTTLLGVSSIDGSTTALVGADPETEEIHTKERPLTSLIDEADSSTTYIGYATIGSATASAVWRIKKISTVSTVTTIAWAGGSQAFSNIWNNRAALSYS